MMRRVATPAVQFNEMIREIAPLAYMRIKTFLKESPEEIKVCATLQALRWRLTKTKRK